MARMNCKCGNLLSNSEAPNDVQLVVYTDREWDEITTPETLESWRIPMPTFDVWRCPKCERIYVFERGKAEAFRVYSLETE